jgi:predicted dehydrogenase
MKQFKVGVCGLGHFGRHFVNLFKAHPNCSEVVLAELRGDVLAETAKENEIERTCNSFDELLKTDVDAVAIYTQRWSHAPLAIKALKAGKHVYSAVPAGVTIEELDELVKTVEETGLTYALGETSYYRTQTIYCRKRFAAGDFGHFVYGEGEYYHDMGHWFYLPFYDANGSEWKKFASVPPMWYPTHSVSHVLGVTFSRFTEVSCFGYADRHEDGIFDPSLSHWGNPFSNQSALFKTADGGMARINEFRRTAAGESRMSIIGTNGAYEEQSNPANVGHKVKDQIEGSEDAIPACNALWTEVYFEKDPHTPDGEYDFMNVEHYFKRRSVDVTDIHKLGGVEITEENIGLCPREYIGKRHLGVSYQHPVERLPKEFIGLRNGHAGSHQFLVHDFMEAMATGKLPPNHVWLSARFNAPGIVAHESCKRGGELMKIPDFGKPPADMELLDPLAVLKD